MSTPRVPHSFFDDTSLYGRLRAASPSDDRAIGYFSWLKKKNELKARQMAARPMAAASAAAPKDEGRLVVARLDRPGAAVRLEEGSFRRPLRDPLAETSYWVEFTLGDREDRPDRETPCRVLLLEPALLDRLRQRLRDLPAEDADAIRQLLGEADLDENRDVAGFLSALPELNGTIGSDGFGSAEIRGLPESAPNVPADAWIVVVYDRR